MSFGNCSRQGEIGMGDLGVFGATVVEQMRVRAGRQGRQGRNGKQDHAGGR